VVQYGNIKYTNIVVKIEKKSNFCLLKVAIVGRTLAFASPKPNFWGDASPFPAIIAAHGLFIRNSIDLTGDNCVMSVPR